MAETRLQPDEDFWDDLLGPLREQVLVADKSFKRTFSWHRGGDWVAKPIGRGSD